mmetsp:Transcript_13398/g.19165  ORF Transcript_13398/g.19165 Transcript_13398/m.19165 type:complete len:545 (+) Transcript_13398:119-1753(+)
MVQIKSRVDSFKKGIDAEKGRRNREETRIKIRKSKREENLLKRRAMGNSAMSSMGSSNELAPTTSKSLSFDRTDQNLKFGVENIPELIAVLSNPNSTLEQKGNSIFGFRKMLSVEKNPPAKQVIDAGALPFFVDLLQNTDNEKIQFEAAWALTNIASTDATQSIVECGAVPPLIAMLLSRNPDCREQSAWCLGNVAGDSTKLRDYVLQCGGMGPMLQNISQPASQSLLGNVVWALSNLCRGKPQPSLELVMPALPYLANLLHSDNKEAQVDALWALSYISDGENERIQAVMNTGITAKVVELLDVESSSIVTPCLRIVGNFATGNDEQTQAVLDADVLQHTSKLLSNPKKNIRKETCWLLSNIAAGTRSQIEHLIKIPADLCTIIEFVQSSEYEVRKEATWVLSNIATSGSSVHVQSIVELGAIDAICSILDVADTKITFVALEAIENILKVGQNLSRDYVNLVDECDGLDKIESLQTHVDDDVYKLSVKIIETYFGVEDEVENENILPENDGEHFTFGVSKSLNFDMENPAATNEQPLTQFNF